MKAIVQEGYGPPDVLKLREVETPAPGDDGVLVEVHAASVNALDWHLARGVPFFIPLLEAIGQRTFRIGDKPPVANLVKLRGNFLLAAAIEGLGEALALVAKAGVDRRQYVDL